MSTWEAVGLDLSPPLSNHFHIQIYVLFLQKKSLKSMQNIVWFFMQ